MGTPSYDLKVRRAKKHLVDLQEAVGLYVDRHPYEVRVEREGKRNPRVHRLRFTEPPDDDIAIISADIVYNLRSALDHLIACLVPSKDRNSVMFPIFFEGVWEPAIEGENEERAKARQRWTTTTRGMDERAIAILKGMQPKVDGEGIVTFPIISGLNRLSNTDRHRKLPTYASHLRDETVICNGRTTQAVNPLTGREALKDGAKLSVPDDAVHVEIRGTTAVSVRLNEMNIEIPLIFEEVLIPGVGQVIDMLRDFDRVND